MKSKEDDKIIKLSEKYNWRAQPKTMRKWRALAACARVVFPDVVLGLYTQDELGNDVVYDDGGDIVVIDPPYTSPAIVKGPEAPPSPRRIEPPAPNGNGDAAASTEPPAPVGDDPPAAPPASEMDNWLGPREPLKGGNGKGKAKKVFGNTSDVMEWVMLNYADLGEQTHAYNAVMKAMGWQNWPDAGEMTIDEFKAAFPTRRAAVTTDKAAKSGK